MILSRKYKFIFIHIPKTAGLSIAQALSEHNESPKRTTKSRVFRRLNISSPTDAAYFKQHDPARTIAGLLKPGEFQKLLSFAVVRNPFDHAVSHYEFMKQVSTGYASLARKLSFEDYLAYRAAPSLRARMSKNLWFSKLPSQSYFVTDRNGCLIVDRIIELDRMSEELPKLLASLKIDPPRIPQINRSLFRQRNRGLAAYYSQGSADLVRRIYAPDFELFGYDKYPRDLA